MNATNIAALPLDRAAERAWRIRHLVDENAMDRNAALFSLSLLHQQSDNDRVRRLCVAVAERVERTRPAPAEPVVESFAR